ncbi:hypothetical protein [Sediminicola luteus]|uniref:Uncharacterized protein n=1 Tax=Sediminicola luteus TaxID=319238 RepID=A0A2A4GE08_9FLAO|nr:hypothetical protein [Sediminicola luteus]PCE66651.1 hypothetical protein B7P33_04980 [Sediminicola luteus]
MKTVLSFLFLFLGVFSISSDKAQLVRDYIAAGNTNTFSEVAPFLDAGYKELFIDGSEEVKNLAHLQEMMAWRKVMQSQIELLDIKSKGDTVVTTEKHQNLLDSYLKRMPRTFKIKYVVEAGKIQQALIDTVPGYGQILRSNGEKLMAFHTYCHKNNLNVDFSRKPEGARSVLEALEQYSKR